MRVRFPTVLSAVIVVSLCGLSAAAGALGMVKWARADAEERCQRTNQALQRCAQDLRAGTFAPRDEMSKPRVTALDVVGADKIRGELGRPIGTVVRATGITEKMDPDNSYYFQNLIEHKIWLRIEKVDGVEVPTKPRFEFHVRHGISDKIEPPKPGDSFDFWGYEMLDYDGIPDDAQPFFAMLEQGTALHLRQDFIILGNGDDTVQ
jgi:hypothetical protein